ncbi:MAG TPA: sugar ABC transporter permease [Bacilli bacterium]
MAFVFITPTMLLFAVFTLIPIVMSLYFSFTNYDVLSRIEFIGLDNYKRMLNDHVLWVTFRNVFIYTLIYVPFNLAISLSLALLLNRPRRGVGVFRTLYYIPTLTSGVAAATVWLWLLNPEYGLINQLLSYAGVTGPAWLATTDTALISVIMVILWQTVGSNMIIYSAGLQGIPDYLYESARLDGAGAFACFRYITLPSLKPTTFFVSTMTIIGALQLFDQPYVLTQGGPANATRTVVYNIYQSGFNELQMGYASAQAFLLAAIILIFAFINMRLNKEGSMI